MQRATVGINRMMRLLKQVVNEAAGEKPEQLSWVSSLLGIGSPGRTMFDHGI
jgi:hypothetical protein